MVSTWHGIALGHGLYDFSRLHDFNATYTLSKYVLHCWRLSNLFIISIHKNIGISGASLAIGCHFYHCISTGFVYSIF